MKASGEAAILEYTYEQFRKAFAEAKAALKEQSPGNWERVDAYVPKDDLSWVGGQGIGEWVEELAGYLREDPEADNHCESDGSGQCLIHFGNFDSIDRDDDEPEVCDLSPDFAGMRG